MARQAQEKQLAEIVQFLQNLIMPKFDSAQKQQWFISKATQYYERDGGIWKCNGQKAPQLVII
jgi:hypothetical protein